MALEQDDLGDDARLRFSRQLDSHVFHLFIEVGDQLLGRDDVKKTVQPKMLDNVAIAYDSALSLNIELQNIVMARQLFDPRSTRRQKSERLKDEFGLLRKYFDRFNQEGRKGRGAQRFIEPCRRLLDPLHKDYQDMKGSIHSLIGGDERVKTLNVFLEGYESIVHLHLIRGVGGICHALGKMLDGANLHNKHKSQLQQIHHYFMDATMNTHEDGRPYIPIRSFVGQNGKANLLKATLDKYLRGDEPA